MLGVHGVVRAAFPLFSAGKWDGTIASSSEVRSGGSMMSVAEAAKEAYPERKSFMIRVGHEAAFHIGGITS